MNMAASLIGGLIAFAGAVAGAGLLYLGVINAGQWWPLPFAIIALVLRYLKLTPHHLRARRDQPQSVSTFRFNHSVVGGLPCPIPGTMTPIVSIETPTERVLPIVPTTDGDDEDTPSTIRSRRNPPTIFQGDALDA